MSKKNIILDKSFDFSLKIINLFKTLQESREFVISKQLLRSGTSIGANLVEGTQSVSKKDFLYKSNIALKEACETLYWLLLLDRSEIVNTGYQEYIDEIDEIISILTRIVKTTKKNLGIE